jgi:hypothetical protein
METYFLASDRPIVKAYEVNGRGTIKKKPYPFVSQFTSFKYSITSLQELAFCIQEFAAQGHCLLKGTLQRPLKHESRAGSTSPDTLTDWVCLDFDGVTTFETVDAALEAMGLGDTSYILQWSASHKVPNEKPGLNCHVFMLLDEPQHPDTLKRWLKYLNLEHFNKQLKLTKSGNALLWPLDITTCQNDKLLYIAPPKFNGLDDPISEDRITIVKRKFERADLSTHLTQLPTPNIIHEREHKALNAARKKAGLKARRTYKFQAEDDFTFLPKPDAAQVTGIKSERGFVYLNLNGGNSWGYFHPIDNPTYIHNFKGEPVYKTEELLPEYWAEIKARIKRVEPDASGRIYLAFRDFETATYWNGIYDAGSNKIVKLAQAKSETQLRHFMKQHGQPIGDFIPDWEIIFDPHAGYVIDQKNKKLNVYMPSKYFSEPPKEVSNIPPTIERIIFHAVGSDKDVMEHFLNWLAVIVQNLGMTQTAWVLHGTQGTGKGVMFNHILTPLFGPYNVTSRRMEELGSDFTEFMKNKFIVFIDEVNSGSTIFHERIAAKLKNLIVEPRISVREMYKPSVVMSNFCNLIFASNSPRPVAIAPDDRRFNVAKYQEDPIEITSDEIAILALELPDFYGYLMTRAADTDIARMPIITEDRKRIINLSRASIDIAIEALKNGDFHFFEEMLVERTEILSPRIQVAYDQYRALIEELKETKRAKLTRDELIIIFRWCVDKIPEAPNKFTSMLSHHGLRLKPLWNAEKKTSFRGFDVGEWQNAS